METALPVGAMLCMGPAEDEGGLNVEHCAMRMVTMVGINCLFDPPVCLSVMARMKAGLKSAGLEGTHLMAQPVGWRVPEGKS